MNNCVDLNQERAKRLFLNMLREFSSKSEFCFGALVTEKLIQDPLQLFEIIDVLWNCNDYVPVWCCHIWNSINTRLSHKLKASTYAELMQECKKEVHDVIYYGLRVWLPDYCKKRKSMYCWFCDRSNNYLDCKGNIYPDLIDMDREIMKMEPHFWVELEKIGIKIGKAEGGTVIKCVHCSTKWDMDLMVHEYHYYPESIKSSRNQARDRVIKEWIENKNGEWYVCPFNCNYFSLKVRGDND